MYTLGWLSFIFNTVYRNFSSPWRIPSCSLQSVPFSLFQTTTKLLSISIVLYFLDFHINEVKWYVLFWVWFISISKMFLRFAHVFYISSLFLFYLETYQFVHSLVDGHLGYFQALVIINEATISIHVQIFVQT